MNVAKKAQTKVHPRTLKNVVPKPDEPNVTRFLKYQAYNSGLNMFLFNPILTVNFIKNVFRYSIYKEFGKALKQF